MQSHDRPDARSGLKVFCGIANINILLNSQESACDGGLFR